MICDDQQTRQRAIYSVIDLGEAGSRMNSRDFRPSVGLEIRDAVDEVGAVLRQRRRFAIADCALRIVGRGEKEDGPTL